MATVPVKRSFVEIDGELGAVGPGQGGAGQAKVFSSDGDKGVSSRCQSGWAVI